MSSCCPYCTTTSVRHDFFLFKKLGHLVVRYCTCLQATDSKLVIYSPRFHVSLVKHYTNILFTHRSNVVHVTLLLSLHFYLFTCLARFPCRYLTPFFHKPMHVVFYVIRYFLIIIQVV